jgi:hypothetical protein
MSTILDFTSLLCLFARRKSRDFPHCPSRPILLLWYPITSSYSSTWRKHPQEWNSDKVGGELQDFVFKRCKWRKDWTDEASGRSVRCNSRMTALYQVARVSLTTSRLDDTSNRESRQRQACAIAVLSALKESAVETSQAGFV